MRVVIAPDSFKGSLSAQHVAASIADGVVSACPDAEVHLVPLADGGEGTVDCLLDVVGGDVVTVPVHDPLGRPIDAHYGVLPDGTVVIEVASAAGLTLVAEQERDVLRGNTQGLGELLSHALDAGRTSFVVALGGSATNDGGVGMLYALGARFYDENGHELAPTPDSCRSLWRIDVSHLHPKLADASIRVACDVANPLCGERGATAVYGPQKGVTPDLIPVLDAFLDRFAAVVHRDLQISIRDIPGAGAAGGLGAALVGLLGAKLLRGIDLILDLTSFDTRLEAADLVITGEGSTDAQTANGKAVMGIATRAKAVGVPVFCLSGNISREATALYEHGVTALFSITQGPMSLADAMKSTGALLARSGESAVRAFLAGRMRR
ncbi:glycerate kinase [Alicyclobacillus fastidiosus]|uniref:Glycerate kinase n=1 Tax=Alicyclobacillus fastidiosus TaxID=392011 RepID=A0ABV5A911_9BACL|nr:glycerate kinase [Alicyclobacillus fastidiosus]WEH10720.1 glycerate kinase [Alicyclobacillus fastidiosus]